MNGTVRTESHWHRIVASFVSPIVFLDQALTKTNDPLNHTNERTRLCNTNLVRVDSVKVS